MSSSLFRLKFHTGTPRGLKDHHGRHGFRFEPVAFTTPGMCLLPGCIEIMTLKTVDPLLIFHLASPSSTK